MVMVKVDEERFLWTNVSRQYYGTFSADLVLLVYGLIMGWLNPAIPILTSDNTPLVTGPLTSEQLSWLGSIGSISGLIGSFIYGYITSIVGCKRAIFFVAVPCIVFWLLIYFGTTYYHILGARFLAGLASGGLQFTVILYVSEIANDDIRGRLASFAALFRNAGIVFAGILGAFLDYKIVPLICVCVPIIFVVIFTFLLNTPQYYLRSGLIKKAEKALMYYKGYRGKNKQEDEALYKELERLKSIASRQKEEPKFEISYLCNRAAIKGLAVAVAMPVFALITANFAFITYAVLVFKKTGTSLDPYISSIVLTISVLLGSLTTTYLADKLGRKVLNFLSMTGSAIGLLSLSLYHYLHLSGYDLSAFSWFPVCSLSFVTFMSSAGILSLVVVCSIEYMPPKIRTFGMTFFIFVYNVLSFASLKIFPIMLDKLDLHGTLGIYGLGSLVSAIFILVAMKDTTGQSLDDIGVDEKIKERSRMASIISL